MLYFLPIALATSNFQHRATDLIQSSSVDHLVFKLTDLALHEVDPLLRRFATAASRIALARNAPSASDEALLASKYANQALETSLDQLEDAIALVAEELRLAGATENVAEAVVLSVGEVKEAIYPSAFLS